jgi:hypothetical protein
MSPYIVTTKRLDSSEGWADSGLRASRLAVATLEEADARVREILVEHDERAGVAPSLPEGGATLSPLPDGTVIEVERTTWQVLVDASGLAVPIDPDAWLEHHEILDAYNARQA